ncbi:MAG: AmmeMemoRadiSam system protein A [Treponema sp.]|nr:AmmeMemoRadiSam system protein A [Treponema sp.]MCL2251910.1 AmmeMemoRadiSam system protein A [Treponema sp.]
MEFTITVEEQKLLLAQAREVITSALEGRKPSFTPIEEKSVLNTPCGAFVSLHMDTGNLRGCIGRMTASLPLIETVRIMAKEAAFGDPRFPPLKKDELPKCNIEISALSPMSPCPDPRQVKVGVHGIYLIYKGRSGVLLPQVPVEQSWNLDEYLEYICIKAGVPPGSYASANAQLFTFTAIVFRED